LPLPSCGISTWSASWVLLGWQFLLLLLLLLLLLGDRTCCSSCRRHGRDPCCWLPPMVGLLMGRCWLEWHDHSCLQNPAGLACFLKVLK
jgi:hypothetical protein